MNYAWDWGAIGLARLFAGNENAVIVAVDHGLYFGPIEGLIDLPTVIKKLKQADGILLSAGMVQHCSDSLPIVTRLP